MATRTRRVSWHGYYRYRTWGYTSEPSPWTYGAKVDLSQLESVTSGDSVPSYRLKIRRHESATTDLVATRYIWRGNNDGLATVQRNAPVPGIITWQRYEIQGTLGLFSLPLDDPSSILISSVKNQCIRKVVSQIQDAQTALRGLVSLGEGAQTVRMLNNRSKMLNRGFFSYLGALTKGSRKVKGLRGMRRFVGNTWLEYSFGWKPLVNDILDGAEALSRIITQKIECVSIGHSAESSEMDPQVFKNELAFAFGPFQIRWNSVSRRTYGCKIYGQVKNTLSVEGVSTEPLREFGLTLNEFVPTLWELIPYSFLVDYFTNVGGIIDGCSLNRSNVAWLNIGEKRETSHEITPLIVNSPCPAGQFETDYISLPGTPFYSSRVHLSRGSYSTGSLIQSLEFKIPGTSTKWLNIAALALMHKRTSALVRSRAGNT